MAPKANVITNPELLELTQRLFEAREAEAKANARRVALEAQFTKLAGIAADFSGSQSFDAGNLKVKYIRTLRTTVDSDKLREIVKNNTELRATVAPAIDWKASLVKREYDKLDEQIKLIIAPAITSKMSKESVKVELPEKEGDIA